MLAGPILASLGQGNPLPIPPMESFLSIGMYPYMTTATATVTHLGRSDSLA